MYAVLVFIACCAAVLGSDCRNLSGLWRNQLGSNMTLVHRPGNQITGEYSTAVESKANAAVVSTPITGNFRTIDGGALLSFTVLFNRGKSLTTWVGECSVCEGEEKLFTTWVLRSYVQKRTDRWMSTRLNQDTFYRVRDSPAPQQGPLSEDEVSPTCRKNIKAGVRGKWVSTSGDSVDFDNCYESGFFSGVSQSEEVLGRSQGGEPFTALGFLSTSGNTVRGWAGHIYEGLSKRELETSWLSHEFSGDCRDPRKHVRFGMTNYTYDASNDDSPSQFNLAVPVELGVTSKKCGKIITSWKVKLNDFEKQWNRKRVFF